MKLFANPQARLCYWFFCVFTVLSLAAVAAWLSLIPKNPVFKISSFTRLPVPSSKNHSPHHNASAPFPDGFLIVGLRIVNPNERMGIYYDALSLKLLDKGGAVEGMNRTGGFYQGFKNYTRIDIVIHVGQEFDRPGGHSGGDEDFVVVRVETHVRFQVIKWKTKAHQVVWEERFDKARIDHGSTFSGGNREERRNETN